MVSGLIERFQLWLEDSGIGISSPFGSVLDRLYWVSYRIEKRFSKRWH